jgi:anti-sigma28 factor (negative regulator of flagellin synthesis)
MVESIHGGPGRNIIITTKPKPKAKDVEKGSFADEIKSKGAGGAEKPAGTNVLNNVAQNNLKIIQNQQVMHMQRVQEIARQVADGTYQMCSPEALAEKLIMVMTDKATRERFIKKLVKEEAEKAQVDGKKLNNPLSELEMKKLIFMIKEATAGHFDDPELEALIESLA